MDFKYKAKKGAKEIVKGTVTAANQNEAIGILSARGLFPIEVEPSTAKQSSLRSAPPAKPSFSIKKIIRSFSKGKVSSLEILLFTQKLATFIRAKMELLASLNIIAAQTDNAVFKKIIVKICMEIKEGGLFSESLARCGIFSPLYVGIVKAGEASGRMDEALTQVTDFMQGRENLKNKVRGALVYPIILLLIGVVSIFVIMNFVIPKLKGIFDELGGSVPLVTKIVLRASQIINQYWLPAIVIAAALVLIFSLRGKNIVLNLFSGLFRHLPIIRRMIENQELVNFSRAFRLLIHSGVTPLSALEVATLTITSPKYRGELDRVAERVRQGQGIAKSMLELTTLPDTFIKMVSVGEESGRLDDVLNELSASYAQQIEWDVGLVTSILEPLLILVLGSVLGVIVLAILLPIFQVTQMIR